MYVGSLPAVSNREDWQQAITLVDADTGELIDISGCDITLTVRAFQKRADLRSDGYGNLTVAPVLTGSTDSGEITLPEDGTFMWTFTASQMSGLCQLQYEIGVRIKQDDRTAQLVIATVEVLEGIDQQ